MIRSRAHQPHRSRHHRSASPQQPPSATRLEGVFEGTLTHWQEDRGFGYIQPPTGGRQVWVHLGAFTKPRRRPQLNQRVRFEIALASDGRPRALNVQPVQPAHTPLRLGWPRAVLWSVPAAAMAYGMLNCL